MKHRQFFCGGILLVAAIVVPGVVCGLVPEVQAQQSIVPRLDDYIEVELGRIDEAYTLIRRFGPQVWPGWTNYLEPEFYSDFPNGVRLLVGSPAHAPEGFERVAGRSLYGKAIYLNRKNELPIKVVQPFAGSGNSGRSVQIHLAQIPNQPDYQPNDGGITEVQILLDVHELFHCLQQMYPAFQKIGERDEGKSNVSGTFTVDLKYATWSSVEGRALLGAYDAKDMKGVRKYLEDYLVARHEKQKGMLPEVIDIEQGRQNPEGSALYSNLKMAMVIRDAKYVGTKRHGDDSFFFKFAHMDDYLKWHRQESTKYYMDSTMDTLVKYYQYGALECFALDRLAPGWKKKFFRSGRTLDDVVSGVLRLKPADEERIKARLSAKYNMAEIEAKHRPVLKECDQALALIAGRKGRRYVVDFSKLQKNDAIAVQPDHSKKNIQLGVRTIFPQGAGIVRVGEVEISTADIPIEKFLRTVEWIDTESKAGEKGYDLKVGSQDGDVLKDIVLTTKGFTLKAPEAQLIEDKEKDEVRVLILSKVKR